MKRIKILTSLFFLLVSINNIARSDDADVNDIIERFNGNPDLSTVVVDTAPGNVSAMSLLGISADDTTIIQNPRNLTLSLKALDSKNAFGLSFSPARTSIMPMDVHTYYESGLARAWANTTFSYAQGTSDDNDVSFERRALAIETSFYLNKSDDQFIKYWSALSKAAEIYNNIEKDGGLNDNVQHQDVLEICDLHPHLKPNSPEEEFKKYQEVSNAQAKACRELAEKSIRWNISKFWLSWATGRYQPEHGGDSHSLGRTGVIGLSLGLGGDNKDENILINNNNGNNQDPNEVKPSTNRDPLGFLFTIAYKHIFDAPVLDTLSEDSPDRENSSLTTLRAAYGSSTLRALFEGSNTSDDTPTALNRTFKRALGLDFKASEGLWVSLRLGKQRKVDNSGDEDGSSVSLSYSPSAQLNL